jgi:hypothetical protein
VFEIELTSAESTAGPPKSETAWLKERRKSWARLIRRVYEVDPLLCRCGQRMRVVGFITQVPVIRKILDHVGRMGSQGLPPSPDHPREKGNAYSGIGRLPANGSEP